MSPHPVIVNRACGTGHSPLDGKSPYTHIISAGANYRSYKAELHRHIDVHARSNERGGESEEERGEGGRGHLNAYSTDPLGPRSSSFSFFLCTGRQQSAKQTHL